MTQPAILLLRPNTDHEYKYYDTNCIITGDHRITNTTRHFFKKHIKKCIIYFDSNIHNLNDLILLNECSKCIINKECELYIYYIKTTKISVLNSTKTKEILLYIQKQTAEFILDTQDNFDDFIKKLII